MFSSEGLIKIVDLNRLYEVTCISKCCIGTSANPIVYGHLEIGVVIILKSLTFIGKILLLFLSFSDTDIDGEFLRTCKTLFDQILECDPAQLRLGSDFLKEFLVRI